MCCICSLTHVMDTYDVALYQMVQFSNSIKFCVEPKFMSVSHHGIPFYSRYFSCYGNIFLHRLPQHNLYFCSLIQYCDVDYDEMDETDLSVASRVSAGELHHPVSPPNISMNTHVSRLSSPSPGVLHSEVPSLPRRNKTPERDSACVPDLPIYDHL